MLHDKFTLRTQTTHCTAFEPKLLKRRARQNSSVDYGLTLNGLTVGLYECIMPCNQIGYLVEIAEEETEFAFREKSKRKLSIKS